MITTRQKNVALLFFNLPLFIINFPKAAVCCGGYRRKEKILKKRIKNTMIRLSAAGAFIALLAAGSTLGSPDFTWDRLPVLIGIMAGSGIWLGLVAYANRPKRKAPSAGQSKEGATQITLKAV